MKKGLVIIAIAFFTAGTSGTISPSWGDGSGMAGFSCVSPPFFAHEAGAPGFSFGPTTTSIFSNVSPLPVFGNDPGSAGFSFGLPAASTLSNIPLRSTQTPALGYPAGAFGVGTISSGMVYHGVSPAGIVRYEQHSSASGIFSYSASYSYQSQFPSSGVTDLFPGFLFLP